MKQLSSFLLGASYMTLGKSVQMWKDWDSEQVEQDFAIMEQIGMNTVKIYLFWEDFFPVPEGGLNETAMAHLDEILEIAHCHNIKLVIDLMVGHMSGENYMVSWSEGRDLMHDPTMLRLQAKYIRMLTSRYRNDDRIVMWDICNEISLYRLGRDGRPKQFPALCEATIGRLGEPPSTDEYYLWLKTLTDAARIGDGTHPVYSGVGTAQGTSMKDMAELTDVNACYAYNWGWAYSMSSYLCGFERALASAHQLPSLVEEFGTSKCWNSERYEADYYGSVLYSSLLNGCVGALSWQYCDFKSMYDQSPYLYHHSEIPFGMVRDDESLRPCCDTMRRFSQFLKREELRNAQLPDPDIHILIPETYDVAHAFNSGGQQNERGVFMAAYQHLRDAGLRVNFIYEDADFIPAGCILVLGQGVKKFKSTTWQKLQQYVNQGGCLWGELNGLPGTYHTDEIYGVEIDYMDHFSNPQIRFENALAHLPQLNWGTGADMMLINADSREVLARDEEGHPVIILHSHEKGKTLLTALPFLQNSAADQALLSALIKELGIIPKVTMSQVGLEAGILSSPDQKHHIVLVVNHKPGKGFQGNLKFFQRIISAEDMDTGNPILFHNTSDGATIPVSAQRGEVVKLLITT